MEFGGNTYLFICLFFRPHYVLEIKVSLHRYIKYSSKMNFKIQRRKGSEGRKIKGKKMILV